MENKAKTQNDTEEVTPEKTEKKTDTKRKWYAIHTYSGYEENVTQNLTQRIETMDMEEKIFNVLVPKEKKIKEKSEITSKHQTPTGQLYK
mgnify:CR=1 FL=1